MGVVFSIKSSRLHHVVCRIGKCEEATQCTGLSLCTVLKGKQAVHYYGMDHPYHKHLSDKSKSPNFETDRGCGTDWGQLFNIHLY